MFLSSRLHSSVIICGSAPGLASAQRCHQVLCREYTI